MVKFCTYNARGLNNFEKRKQLFSLLKYKQIDVILIQESHGRDSVKNMWQSQWGGNVVFANGCPDSRGVMILFKRGLSIEMGKKIMDPNGRYIITEMTIDQYRFVLCNVYAPNTDLPEFLKRWKNKWNPSIMRT